jgi:hypothetical protein
LGSGPWSDAGQENCHGCKLLPPLRTRADHRGGGWRVGAMGNPLAGQGEGWVWVAAPKSCTSGAAALVFARQGGLPRPLRTRPDHVGGRGRVWQAVEAFSESQRGGGGGGI